MNDHKLTENELWILSFYRTSEITGALFFGGLAKKMKPGPIQRDLTKHFADESQHSWIWTNCVNQFGAEPMRLSDSYQDKYLEAAGVPVNLMEILAVTQVFEKRVIGQYAKHRTLENLDPRVEAAFSQIMEDEKWHIEWIGAALKDMEKQYGAELVQSTVKRFSEADQHVFEATMKEHEQRMNDLFENTRRNRMLKKTEKS
jgi:hypothetical protein